MGRITHPLAIYLSSLRFRPYIWGTLDCNLFIVDWIDSIDDTNIAKEIRGMYNTKISAYKFAKKYTSAPDYLQSVGFEQLLGGGDKQNGDIILQQHGHIYNAWLILENKAYSYAEDIGIGIGDPKEIGNDDQTVWRRT